MKEINSKQNPIIVQTAKLKDKKYRKQNGEFLIEGKVMITDAMNAGYKVKKAFFSEVDEQLAFTLENNGCRVYSVNKAVIECLTDTVTPQGIVAVVERREQASYVLENISVILDNVQDPGNFGTIIRTCACAGVKQLFLVNCVDAYNPKCIRSTMSGIFNVEIYEVCGAEIIEHCKNSGISIVLGDFGGINVFDCKPLNKFALVIGNEANGVSAQFKQAGDMVVTIPMSEAMQSLNAGVSHGIILYQLINKRG